MAKTGRRGKGDDRETKNARVVADVTASQKSKLGWLSLHLKISIAELIGQWIEKDFQAAQGFADGEKGKGSVDQSETLELLIGFMNYLIDNHDHDGYSLAEISELLGRADDKGLVALLQKLQNGKESTVKRKAAKP